MNRESSGPGIDSGIVRAGPWPVQLKRSGELLQKAERRISPLFLRFYLYYKSFQQNYSQSICINKKGERDPQHQTGKGCCLRPLGYWNSTVALLLLSKFLLVPLGFEAVCIDAETTLLTAFLFLTSFLLFPCTLYMFLSVSFLLLGCLSVCLSFSLLICFATSKQKIKKVQHESQEFSFLRNWDKFQINFQLHYVRKNDAHFVFNHIVGWWCCEGSDKTQSFVFIASSAHWNIFQSTLTTQNFIQFSFWV